MIEKTDFLNSVEANIKCYEDQLADTPKACNGIRNMLHGQIRAIHKLKADVLLGKDGTQTVSKHEAEVAEELLAQLVHKL